MELPLSGPNLCGCYDNQHDGHFEHLSDFADSLNSGLKSLRPSRQPYDRVKVLSIRWQESDLEDLVTNATELEDVLRDGYGFTVPEPFILKNGSLHDEDKVYAKFEQHLRGCIDDLGDRTVDEKDMKEHNLLIIYYAGHGSREEIDGGVGYRYVWQAKRERSMQLPWPEFESSLSRAKCDKLFLLDCCFALAMVEEDRKWRRRCEVLCACGPNDQAAAPSRSRVRPDARTTTRHVKLPGDFTKALTMVLRERKTDLGLNVLKLSTIMTETRFLEKHDLRPMPVRRQYSKDPSYQSSILLESRNLRRKQSGSDEDSIISTMKELDCLSDANIIIRVRLRNAAEELLTPEWISWLSNRPGPVAGMEASVLFQSVMDRVKVIDLFPSDSSLLLVVMPLWLWNLLPRNIAYASVGIIRGDGVISSGLIAGKGDTQPFPVSFGSQVTRQLLESAPLEEDANAEGDSSGKAHDSSEYPAVSYQQPRVAMRETDIKPQRASSTGPQRLTVSERMLTLHEFLTSPNPPLRSKPRTKRSSTTMNPKYPVPHEIKHWTEFNVETILSMFDGVLHRILHERAHMPDPTERFPVPSMFQVIDSETDLQAFTIKWHQSVVLEALEKTSTAILGFGVAMVASSRACQVFNVSESSFRGVTDWAGIVDEKRTPESVPLNILPGESTTSWKWDSAKLKNLAGTAISNAVIGQLRRIAAVCIFSYCRYGYIISDEELVVFRVGGAEAEGVEEVVEPKDCARQVWNKCIVEWHAIPQHNSGLATGMTVNLALWVLHILAANNGRLQVTPYGNLKDERLRSPDEQPIDLSPISPHDSLFSNLPKYNLSRSSSDYDTDESYESGERGIKRKRAEMTHTQKSNIPESPAMSPEKQSSKHASRHRRSRRRRVRRLQASLSE